MPGRVRVVVAARPDGVAVRAATPGPASGGRNVSPGGIGWWRGLGGGGGGRREQVSQGEQGPWVLTVRHRERISRSGEDRG